MTAPYSQDDHVTLYHGDCREITEWRGVMTGLLLLAVFILAGVTVPVAWLLSYAPDLHGQVTRMRPGVGARRRARLVVFHLFVERVSA